MLVYKVTWLHDSNLSRGKGRAKNSDSYFVFTVLCRNSKDAMSCLDYHFNHMFPHSDNVFLDDGVVTLTRSILDSRCFHVHYLMMDGIRQPLHLDDLKNSNILRLHQIFR